jgi:predicted dehydrogenase
MSPESNEEIALIGAGYMGIEYAKVLENLKVGYFVIGRGEKSALNFEDIIKKKVIRGGLEKWVKDAKIIPRIAIVTVPENDLGNATRILLNFGVKKILLEKPGGLDVKDVQEVATLAKAKNAEVIVGYNRRFYGSVLEAEKIIKEDGGIQLMTFEFTEWGYKIKAIDKPKETKANWYYQNSTHVIDLAFFMAGFPKEMVCYKDGSLDWHPDGSRFVGAGITNHNILFSYHANWEAPGRWGLEINTSAHRLIFRPLEKLKTMIIGSVAIDDINYDEKLDVDFKPGIFLQVKAFLDGDYSRFPDIHQQSKHMQIYEKILKGNK